MTSDELQAIRERVTGASDGPWSVRRIPNSYDSPVGDRYTHPCVRGFRVPRRLYNLAWEQVEKDAEFMAQARQDVPALIAEVDRLRTALQECGAAVKQMIDAGDASLENLARIEQFLDDEQGQANGRSAEVRRLYLSQPKMRPKDPAAGGGKVTPFPVAKAR